MRDIFYNQTHKIGSDYWMQLLNEAELSEWNWIQNNIDEVKKRADEFDVKKCRWTITLEANGKKIRFRKYFISKKIFFEWRSSKYI